MRPLALMIGLLGVAMLPLQCGAQIWDNPFAEYFERGVTVTPEGGNAKDANAAIHTINPWPPYVGNTRITQDGRAAVNAVERMYQKCQIFPLAQSISSGSYRRQQHAAAARRLAANRRLDRSGGLGRGWAAAAAAQRRRGGWRPFWRSFSRRPYWRPLEPHRRIDPMRETTTRIYQIIEISSSVSFSAKIIVMPAMITTITTADLCSDCGGSGS